MSGFRYQRVAQDSSTDTIQGCNELAAHITWSLSLTLLAFGCFVALMVGLSTGVSRYEFPIFRIDRIDVSNFNPVSPGFIANWDVNATIKNVNSGLTVSSKKVKANLYYREDSVLNDRLASAAVQPFFLENKARTEIQAKLSANSSDIALLRGSVVEEMAKDWKSGTVPFDVHFEIRAMFDQPQGFFWPFRTHQHVDFTFICEDIRVHFAGGARNGSGANGGPVNEPSFCEGYFSS